MSARVTAALSSAFSRMACSAVSSRRTSCSLSTSRSSCVRLPFLAGAGAGLALPRGSGMALFGEHGRSKHLGKVWQWDELMKRACGVCCRERAGVLVWSAYFGGQGRV
jgi:hypothetical protein